MSKSMAQLSDHSVLGVAVGPLLILDFLEFLRTQTFYKTSVAYVSLYFCLLLM